MINCKDSSPWIKNRNRDFRLWKFPFDLFDDLKQMAVPHRVLFEYGANVFLELFYMGSVLHGNRLFILLTGEAIFSLQLRI